MKGVKTWQKAVLVALLVLPSLIYFIFVYGAEENFFQTLDYVGPVQLKSVVDEAGQQRVDSLPYAIPDYRFRTQDDSLLSSAKHLRGKIYVANFFFSSCPTICPAMNFNMRQVQDRFKGYDKFRTVSFSVDPEYDQPAVLKSYAKKIGAIPGRWYFLTGDRDSLYATAADFFLSAMEDETAAGGFLHSEHFVIVDWAGRIRSRRDEDGNLKAVYSGTSQDEVNKLIDDLKVLIAEYEKKQSVDEYRASKAEKKKSKQP